MTNVKLDVSVNRTDIFTIDWWYSSNITWYFSFQTFLKTNPYLNWNLIMTIFLQVIGTIVWSSFQIYTSNNRPYTLHIHFTLKTCTDLFLKFVTAINYGKNIFCLIIRLSKLYCLIKLYCMSHHKVMSVLVK